MTVPREFFKYRSISGTSALWLERTICHDEIYVGTSEQFNDPFDCSPIFDMDYTEADLRALASRVISKNRPEIGATEIQNAIESFIRTASGFNREEANEHLRLAHETRVKAGTGVYCIADKPDNLLMWSHYADSHRGVCLGFDPERFPFDVAQQVTYSLERERVLPSDDHDEKLRKALLCKSKDWEYESEWRIVDPFHPTGSRRIHPRALQSIILGALISDQNKQQVLAWSGTRTYQPKIFQAHISTEKFAVEVRPA
jgi:hypothetical protein